MFDHPYVWVGFALLALAALISLFLVRKRGEKIEVDSAVDHDHHAGHNHQAPPADQVLLTPQEGDFSSVHAGKKWTGGCKFDPAEVRRSRFMAGPKIDTTNLPAPNPVVVAAINQVSIDNLKDTMLKLSGEIPMIVGGKSVQIATRNTYHPELGIAMSYMEEAYKALGISVSRSPYKVRGKTFENLVAVIPGSVDPKKVLILGSHLDSTAGRPWGIENKAPGADDDGSGSAAVLEMARIIKGLKLPYTVQFLHFTGEEQGLWGSYAYSDIVAAAKTEVIAMLQIDMIAYCNKPGNRLDIHDGVNKNGSHEIVVKFFRAIKRYGININPVDTHNNAVTDRSDQAGFLDHGYKAVLISEEFSDDGFNPNYHSLNDRVVNCNMPYMTEVAKAVLVVAAEYGGLN